MGKFGYSGKDITNYFLVSEIFWIKVFKG